MLYPDPDSFGFHQVPVDGVNAEADVAATNRANTANRTVRAFIFSRRTERMIGIARTFLFLICRTLLRGERRPLSLAQCAPKYLGWAPLPAVAAARISPAYTPRHVSSAMVPLDTINRHGQPSVFLVPRAGLALAYAIRLGPSEIPPALPSRIPEDSGSRRTGAGIMTLSPRGALGGRFRFLRSPC
jgi:hypothetical protein